MVSLSNHVRLGPASFDKLRMSGALRKGVTLQSSCSISQGHFIAPPPMRGFYPHPDPPLKGEGIMKGAGFGIPGGRETPLYTSTISTHMGPWPMG